jgi:diacylglycerol kinase family enzyme
MYYYIINPSSGRGRINTIQDRLRTELNNLGIGGEFAKTTGPGDASKMAKAAAEKGFNTIVAVGGDNTVNEVINGLAGTDVAIGIIPIGATNELANQFGITNWQQAAQILAARRITSYGLIAAGQKFFLSTLSLGFETDLDKNVDTTPANGLSQRLQQFKAAFGHARSYKSLRCHITLDDKLEIDADIFSLSLSNQKFDNPLANNELIINLIDKPRTTSLATYLWRHLKGSKPIADIPTTRLHGQRAIIATTPPTGIMIDGKLTGRTPIAIRLTDRRVRIITEKQLSAIKQGL